MDGTLTFVDRGAGSTAAAFDREHTLSTLTAVFLGATLTFPLMMQPAAAQDPSQTVTTLNVTGRVVNARTGAAIPRALVNLNGRSVLTDPLGQFTFPSFQPAKSGSALQAYAQVSKPGYSPALDATEGNGQLLSNISGPIELKLYPDGLISGIVTGSDGEPLERVQISISREMGEDGAMRLQPIGFTMTDSHGEYRLEEPPGRYSLLLRYTQHGGSAGEAILPQRYPAETGSYTLPAFILAPGDQAKIDLHPRTGPSFPVTFRSDAAFDGLQNLRISVRSGIGESFSVYAQPSGTSGEFRIELPSGSYSLRATQQRRDRALEAEGSVTVPGHAVTGLTLHFTDIPTVRIQVLPDTVATGVQPTEAVQDQPPTPMSLNLHFHKLDATEEEGENQLRIATMPDKSFAINVGSGTYRLSASPSPRWYITQATYGSTNLFTHPLTVAPGAGGESIRIIVSQGFGEVAGVVRRDGVPVGGSIYLFPREGGLVPVYTARTNRDGSYVLHVPPGEYTVVALDHRVPGDASDPAVQTQLTRGGVAARVIAGGQTSLDLDQQALETVK